MPSSAMTLRAAREGRKLTQVRLAALSGVRQSTISAIERGDVQSPSWDTVYRLSRALKLRPEEIFPVADLAVGA